MRKSTIGYLCCLVAMFLAPMCQAKDKESKVCPPVDVSNVKTLEQAIKAIKDLSGVIDCLNQQKDQVKRLFVAPGTKLPSTNIADLDLVILMAEGQTAVIDPLGPVMSAQIGNCSASVSNFGQIDANCAATNTHGLAIYGVYHLSR